MIPSEVATFTYSKISLISSRRSAGVYPSRPWRRSMRLLHPCDYAEMITRMLRPRDKLAMQVLFARHRTPVYRWLLRFVGNETVAEDLLSDVFFDVWQQAGRFEGRSAVSTWLLSIARFKALSASRRRTDAPLDGSIEATVANSADDAEVVLGEKRPGEMLRDALTKLSPEHREIIDLVYYHEKSVDDAADILSIPRATVKTRMFYARKKLAELVQRA